MWIIASEESSMCILTHFEYMSFQSNFLKCFLSGGVFFMYTIPDFKALGSFLDLWWLFGTVRAVFIEIQLFARE